MWAITLVALVASSLAQSTDLSVQCIDQSGPCAPPVYGSYDSSCQAGYVCDVATLTCCRDTFITDLPTTCENSLGPCASGICPTGFSCNEGVCCADEDVESSSQYPSRRPPSFSSRRPHSRPPPSFSTRGPNDICSSTGPCMQTESGEASCPQGFTCNVELNMCCADDADFSSPYPSRRPPLSSTRGPNDVCPSAGPCRQTETGEAGCPPGYTCNVELNICCSDDFDFSSPYPSRRPPPPSTRGPGNTCSSSVGPCEPAGYGSYTCPAGYTCNVEEMICCADNEYDLSSSTYRPRTGRPRSTRTSFSRRTRPTRRPSSTRRLPFSSTPTPREQFTCSDAQGPCKTITFGDQDLSVCPENQSCLAGLNVCCKIDDIVTSL